MRRGSGVRRCVTGGNMMLMMMILIIIIISPKADIRRLCVRKERQRKRPVTN
jgi:hypothetical protein